MLLPLLPINPDSRHFIWWFYQRGFELFSRLWDDRSFADCFPVTFQPVIVTVIVLFLTLMNRPKSFSENVRAAHVFFDDFFIAHAKKTYRFPQ